MSATTERVFIEALSLPARARAALVKRLLLSLESEDETAEIEAAWKREIADRCRACEEGKITECDAEEVFRDAFKKLK
jgi:putative addiction module component (TIGR02574 family)